MRRSRWQRAFAGVLGLWFAVCVPGTVLPVQMLAFDGGSMADMAGMTMAHRSDSQCASAHRVPAGPVKTDTGPKAPARHHGDCPGACCTACCVTVVTGRSVSIPVVPIAVLSATPAPTADVPQVQSEQVVLPPPLGPPSLRA